MELIILGIIGVNILWVFIYCFMQKATDTQALFGGAFCAIGIIVIKILDKSINEEFLKGISELINLTQSLEILLGITSILMAIYVYSISLNDDFKKHILLILLGKGRALYLGMMMLIFYYFNIAPFYFISLIVIMFIELYYIIEITFLAINTIYFKENWKNYIIPKLKLRKNIKNLQNIYYELRKRITKAMLEKDFIVFEEMLAYYKDLLMTDGFEIPEDFIKKRIEKYKNQEEDFEEKEKAVGFLYEIYIYLLENRDDNLFDKIENLNIDLAEYYLEKEDYRLAREYYSFLSLKYDYLNEKYKYDIKEKGFHLFTGLRYYHSSIKNLTEQKEIVILKSILDLFYKLIKEEKYEEVEEYISIFVKKDCLLEIYARVIIFHILIHLFYSNRNSKKEDTILKLKNQIIELFYYKQDNFFKLYRISREKNWKKNLEI